MRKFNVNNYLKTSEEKQLNLFAKKIYVMLSLHQQTSQAFKLKLKIYS